MSVTGRELSDRTREIAHRKLDEILAMYQQGADLWIVTDLLWVETSGDSASPVPADPGGHPVRTKRTYTTIEESHRWAKAEKLCAEARCIFEPARLQQRIQTLPPWQMLACELADALEAALKREVAGLAAWYQREPSACACYCDNADRTGALLGLVRAFAPVDGTTHGS